MKAIIYVGIGLFSAATVYGVADYYATEKRGTMDKIYKEEEPVLPVKEETINTVELPLKNEAVKPGATKIAVTKVSTEKTFKKFKAPVREIKFSDFSRGRIVPKKVVEEVKIVEPVIEKENK